jgi:hypothetical protein
VLSSVDADDNNNTSKAQQGKKDRNMAISPCYLDTNPESTVELMNLTSDFLTKLLEGILNSPFRDRWKEMRDSISIKYMANNFSAIVEIPRQLYEHLKHLGSDTFKLVVSEESSSSSNRIGWVA